MNDLGNPDQNGPSGDELASEKVTMAKVLKAGQFGERTTQETHGKELQAFLDANPYIAATMKLDHDSNSFLAMIEEGKDIVRTMPDAIRDTLPEIDSQMIADFDKYNALNSGLSQSERADAIRQLLLVGYKMNHITNFIKFSGDIVPHITEAYIQRGILRKDQFEKNGEDIYELIELTIQNGIKKAMERKDMSASQLDAIVQAEHSEDTTKLQSVRSLLYKGFALQNPAPSEPHPDKMEPRTVEDNRPPIIETKPDLPDSIPDNLTNATRKSLGLPPKPSDDESDWGAGVTVKKDR